MNYPVDQYSLPAKQILFLKILIAAAVLVNFSGLFVTIIGPDGALYASIAKTMAVNNNYLELFVEGKDWLDKPHFPFWISALSFEIFGISTWSYKLPAILVLLGGAWYTFAFAKKLYGYTCALVSTLIFLTAEHIILSNNDVRAEPYLTALIISSTYYFYLSLEKEKNAFIIPASILAAFAIMTKGVFALIPVGAAIGGAPSSQ